MGITAIYSLVSYHPCITFHSVYPSLFPGFSIPCHLCIHLFFFCLADRPPSLLRFWFHNASANPASHFGDRAVFAITMACKTRPPAPLRESSTLWVREEWQVQDRCPSRNFECADEQKPSSVFWLLRNQAVSVPRRFVPIGRKRERCRAVGDDSEGS